MYKWNQLTGINENREEMDEIEGVVVPADTSKLKGKFYIHQEEESPSRSTVPFIVAIEFSRNTQSWQCWHFVLLIFENK